MIAVIAVNWNICVRLLPKNVLVAHVVERIVTMTIRWEKMKCELWVSYNHATHEFLMCPKLATRVLVWYSPSISYPLIWLNLVCDNHFYSQFAGASELWGNELEEVPIELYEFYFWEHMVLQADRSLSVSLRRERDEWKCNEVFEWTLRGGT